MPPDTPPVAAPVAATAPGGDGVCVFEWDAASDALRGSPGYLAVLEQATGATPTTGRALLDLLEPADRDQLHALRAALTPAQPIYATQWRTCGVDGQQLLVEERACGFFDSGERLVRLIGSVSRPSATNDRSTSLPAGERIYRAIGESIDYGVWVCAPDGRNLYASDSFLAMVGITQEQCADFGWGEVLHPDDADRTIAAWQECVETGGIWDVEHRFLGADGNWHDVLARGVPVRNERGELVCWAGINLDISRQKRTEQALREAEAYSSAILDAVSAHVAVLDRNGNIVAVNAPWRAFAAANSMTPGQPAPRTDVGTNYLAVCRSAAGESAAAAQAVCDGLRQVLDGSVGHFTIEYPCHAPDQQRWFLLTATALGGGRGGAVVAHTDITRVMRLSQDLEAARRRLQALMDALPVGVSFSEDPDCRRVTGNPTLLAQFEVTNDDNVSASAPEPTAAGRRVRYLQNGREVDDRELPLQRAAAEGTAVAPVELEIHLPSGRRWFAEVSAAPLRDTEGRITGSAAVIVDITERKQMEEALREADQRKDEFLAMLAHELRNPLTPIRNAVHIMGLLDLHQPRLRWAREVIDSQLRHLTRLVDDLMDVSRFMRGKITLSKEVLDVASVMDSATATLLPVIEGRGQRLTVRLPPERIWLNVDRIRLTQILTNLLDNASKFSADGGQIELAAEAAGNEVAIRVRDNGPGIAPALLPHVFDLFRQGDTTLDRPMGGLGIGLTLAQRLASLQGGRIEATSAGIGQGSTFTVRLPIAAPAATAAPEPAHESLRPAAPVRVLVVDDDAAVADSTSVWLEMMGYDPRIARSGPDALDLAETFRPQVVLLDIGLSGLNGYKTAQRLRGLPGGDDLLLVAITGYGDDEAVARSRAAGFDHHLVKPFDPRTLLGLLAARFGTG